MAIDAIDATVGTIVAAMSHGRVVPFIGAGANLLERPEGTAWEKGRWLPSSSELADVLTRWAGAEGNELQSLTIASQYLEVMQGQEPLYEALDDVFDADYPPSSVLRFVAGLPRLPERELLVVTTNYDDALERAFDDAGIEHDVVTYIANPSDTHRGRFRHTPPKGASTIIDDPAQYGGLDLARRSVVLKIHGAVDRVPHDALLPGADHSEVPGYVITEDDYIDYMVSMTGEAFLPVVLGAKLRDSHMLFLGYSLRDWNLRVLLTRLWGWEGRPRRRSWAVHRTVEILEEKFWGNRGVDILEMELQDFIDRVRRGLEGGD